MPTNRNSFSGDNSGHVEFTDFFQGGEPMREELLAQPEAICTCPKCGTTCPACTTCESWCAQGGAVCSMYCNSTAPQSAEYNLFYNAEHKKSKALSNNAVNNTVNVTNQTFESAERNSTGWKNFWKWE